MLDGKKILTILPKRLGDTIFITPALALLKKYCPNSELGAVCLSALSEEVLKNNPSIDALYLNPCDDQITQLQSAYDVLLILHTGRYASAEAARYAMQTLTIPEQDLTIPTADYHLNFVRALLHCEIAPEDRQYFLYPTQVDVTTMAERLKQKGVNANDVLIGFHLGSHGLAKRGLKFWKRPTHKKVWPIKRFIQLASQLQKVYPKVKFVVTGSQGEAMLAKQFCAKVSNSMHFIDQANVVELFCLMKRLRLYITPDTGPMHVACAANIPLLALFLNEYYSYAKPYPDAPYRRVLRADTIEAISVKTAFEHCQQLLGG